MSDDSARGDAPTSPERLIASGLTSGQAARRLGVSPQSINVATRSGRLPSLKTPLGNLYSRSDLDQLAADRAARAATTAAARKGGR